MAALSTDFYTEEQIMGCWKKLFPTKGTAIGDLFLRKLREMSNSKHETHVVVELSIEEVDGL